MRRSNKGGLLLCVLLLAACGGVSLEPVALSPEDMCAHCKMAIAEKQYAAEFITKDGDVLKFDDLSCLASYVAARKNREQIAVVYVMDFETKQWLKAEEAVFAQAANFRTPMSGGIAAFKDKVRAEAVAQQGRLLSFEEVLASGK
jgi:copper chaperone NosL